MQGLQQLGAGVDPDNHLVKTHIPASESDGCTFLTLLVSNTIKRLFEISQPLPTAVHFEDLQHPS